MTCAEEGFIIGCVYHVVVTPLTQGEEQRGGNQSKFSCLALNSSMDSHPNTSQISSTPTLSHSSYGPLTRTCCPPPPPPDCGPLGTGHSLLMLPQSGTAYHATSTLPHPCPKSTLKQSFSFSFNS